MNIVDKAPIDKPESEKDDFFQKLEPSISSKFLVELEESDVSSELRELLSDILNVQVSEPAKVIGTWTQTRLDREAFEVYGESIINRIVSYAEYPNANIVTQEHLDSFKNVLENLKSTISEFRQMTLPQYKPGTPQHFKHVLTVFNQTFRPFVDIIETVTGHSTVTTKPLEYDEFLAEKDNLDGKIRELSNLIGDTSTINARLNDVKKKVRRLSSKSDLLDDKVNKINQANEYVEKLPQIIEELDVAKVDILETKEQSDKDKFKSEENLDESNQLLSDLRKLKDEAEQLVRQCRNARQITITESLGKGFDDKAKKLRWSIRLWVLGLMIGLAGGVFVAHERVEALKDIISLPLTSGQSILHLAVTFLSFAGPLWWAWLCTSKINKTFKLSEDYSYKASVAKAYTGFQDEAARFDDDISKRLFKSAVDRFDEMPLRLIDTQDHSSPWQDLLSSSRVKSAFKNSHDKEKAVD